MRNQAQEGKPMRILTICTPDWYDAHLRRFVHYCKRAMPDVPIGVLVACPSISDYTTDPRNVGIPIDEYIEVRLPRQSIGPRDSLLWFDRERLNLAARFGDGPYLYSDPDVDVLDDLTGIEALCTGPQSVFAVPEPFCGGRYVNNGFLYVRGSVLDEYDAAICVRDMPQQEGWRRFAGLEQARPDTIGRLPYYYNVIWHDVPAIERALSVHWCNSVGKRLRQWCEYDVAKRMVFGANAEGQPRREAT